MLGSAATLTTKLEHRRIRREPILADSLKAQAQVDDGIRQTARILQAGIQAHLSPVWSVAVSSGSVCDSGSTADVCRSLRTLVARSTLIGRRCLRHTEGPGGA